MSLQSLQHLIATMNLEGLRQQLELLLADPASQALSHTEFIEVLLSAELNYREHKRLSRMTRNSKLKMSWASVEDIDYRSSRGLKKSDVADINNCQWVTRLLHIVLTGETGTGKTWLACAWAMQCLRQGIPVLYYRLPILLETCEISRADGSLPKLRAKLAKCPVLVMDDWGVAPLSSAQRQDLLEIIEDRTDRGSLIITSQLPIAQWHDFIGEPTVADAILDRIVHRSYTFTLKGESMRKVHSPLKKGAK